MKFGVIAVKRRAHIRIVTAFSLLLISGILTPVFASSVPPEENTSTILEAKTFDRWPDPVVADGGLFSSFLGKKIEFLRAYVYSDDSFHPIPFQIDEKDSGGELVLTSGDKTNLKDSNGLLDKGEELVFMSRDSGDRVSRELFPPGVELWEVLELQDPLTNGKGWIYLLYSESNPPPLSKDDYIIYIPVYKESPQGDCQVMKSKYFVFEHYPIEPYFDVSKYSNVGLAHRRMSFTREAGGTGADIVDRFKNRVTVAFFFGLLKFRVDENDISFYEHAYKDGPVRIIKKIQGSLNLPLGIKAPGGMFNIIQYETVGNVPLILDIPFNPGYLYTYLELDITEDRSREAFGMKVYSSNNLKGCLVDGKIEGEAETNWNTERDSWRVITGKQGTVINRSFWDQRYLEQVDMVKIEYIDNLEREDPPEEEPGMIGMIRQTNRVEGIKREQYFSYLEWYYPPSFLLSGPDQTYQLGDEKIYLNIADHPVMIRAGELTMESHYFGQIPDYEKAEQLKEKKPERAESGQKK